MRGDLLDVVLLLAALLFAVSGYRQGFVVGVLSFVGFLGGGLLGAAWGPRLADTDLLNDLPRPAVGLVAVLVAASLGQIGLTMLGATLRRRLTWKPARQLDAMAGAVISVVGLLLVSWLVARAVAGSSSPTLASQVRRSVVIETVDGLVPDAGRRLFSSFRSLVDERDFPEVFDRLQPTVASDLPAPDPALARSPAVARARDSVLKVTGEARSCRTPIQRQGSGFVYADERVLTNAHVVAGVQEPSVEVGDRQLEASVVLFDPARDIAVLAVPGLERPALDLRVDRAEAGDGGVVAGYPQDGPFRPVAARVSGTSKARGTDIYNRDQVVREVYTLLAEVLPGNSGGPLLDLQGRVYGLVFAAAADNPRIGYALTAAEVAPQAERGRVAGRAVSTGTCR